MRIATLSLRYFTPVLALTAALAACAPAPIYKPAPNAVMAVPAQVAQSPERYAGSEVIWGGRIVGVQNFTDHSEIELLAYPLDASQRPKVSDVGNGRFLAVVAGYAEPLNYPAGALMTVSGKLQGSRAGKVGDADYVFPLVGVTQSHVWTAEEMNKGRSNFHFGVGVGVGIR
jgi:outer membrane lipoprotein